MDCYRCGGEVEPESFDLAGWTVIHAWEDGHALFICPSCQSVSEREVAESARSDLDCNQS